MTRRTYSFVTEPKGLLYAQLLDAAVTMCTTAGMVVQKARTYPLHTSNLLESLEKYLLSFQDQQRWPGTELASGFTEQVRKYTYDSEVALLLKTAADSLFEWVNPELPDDLHFERADGTVWLGSIAHERDAWLELDPTEYDELKVSAPDVAKALHPDKSRLSMN